MIKFFRNLRKKNLKEGKNTNYLKYAIGEIILVVIGILIALQVNNWNETKKNQRTEKDYLSSLRSDLEDDVHTQDSIIQILNETSITIDSLLYQLEGLQPDSDTKQAFKYWKASIGFPDYISKEHTIETLKSSGKIEHISDETIRRMIQAYYDETDRFYIHQSLLDGLSTKTFLNDIVFNLSALRKDTDKPVPLLSSSQNTINTMYNNIYIYQLMIESSSSKLQNLMKEANKNLKAINSYDKTND